LHRAAYPNGIECSAQDVARWDSPYALIEQQANTFAAICSCRSTIFAVRSNRVPVDLDMISHCADRYRVSLIAAILRWLAFTDRRAVLVVSRDGFILWSRSSAMAMRTGAFFRTSGQPVEIPAAAIAATQDKLSMHAPASNTARAYGLRSRFAKWRSSPSNTIHDQPSAARKLRPLHPSRNGGRGHLRPFDQAPVKARRRVFKGVSATSPPGDAAAAVRMPLVPLTLAPS